MDFREWFYIISLVICLVNKVIVIHGLGIREFLNHKKDFWFYFDWVLCIFLPQCIVVMYVVAYVLVFLTNPIKCCRGIKKRIVRMWK